MDPNAECRSYVDHLHAEHRRLQKLISDVQHAIAAWVADGQSEQKRHDELAVQLGKLRGELEHHFAEEEEGGCLEESLSHNPTLSTDVKAALLEHPALLKSVSEIADRLREPASSVSPSDVQTMFDALANRLRLHEATEERVLRLGFGSVATE